MIPGELSVAIEVFQEKLKAIQATPQWGTNRPYAAILQGTAELAEEALKTALMSYARAYVEIASSGTLGQGEPGKADVPEEFEERYAAMVEIVRSADDLPSLCAALRDEMWDQTHWGIFLDPAISWSESSAEFHLDANSAILDNACQSVWQIRKASDQIAKYGVILASRIVWDGYDAEAGADLRGLAFWSDQGPPPYILILTALGGSATSERMAVGTMDAWSRSWDYGIDQGTLGDFRRAVDEMLRSAGGLAGVTKSTLGFFAAMIGIGLLLRARG